MFKEITVNRVSAGTLFKLVAIGLSITFILFSVLMGCFALFGAHTVTWNKHPLTGFSGLVASPFIGILIAVIFTIFLGSCMAFGLWLYSKFKPLTLLVRVSDAEQSA
jgi:branched-subunit amino acid ABC-type transport system permease component